MDVSWMYEKKRGRPEAAKEDKPKFKGSKKFYLIAGGVALVLIGGMIGAYFIFESRVVEEQKPIELTEDCAKTLNSYKDGKLSVILCVKKDGSLAIYWQNLPKETTTLNIYRKDGETGDSVLWKTVNITGESGSFDLGKEEGGVGSATYTVEGVGASGATNWSSVGNTTSAGTSGSPSSPGQTSTSSSQTTNPTTPPPTTPPPTTPPPSQNTTSTTTPPPTTPPPSATSTPPVTPPTDTSTIYYYTPSGQISGTSSISVASFWVQHVNKKIEIGWQNISSSTTKVIIYRSQSESSGYTKLLEQTDLLTSYVIRLEDNAVTEDYYYKMETKNGSTLIATYGPFFLPGLE